MTEEEKIIEEEKLYYEIGDSKRDKKVKVIKYVLFSVFLVVIVFLFSYFITNLILEMSFK